VVLNEPSEGLCCRAAHYVQGRPVKWIEKADAGGVAGGVGVVRVEIAKGRKGRRPPGICEGIEIIGRAAAAAIGIERSELEIGRRRTRRARDIGYIAARGIQIRRETISAVQQPFAVNRFGCVQVATDASRLIVERPQPLGGSMEHRKELQAFDQRVLLRGGGIRVN
jgi:hypothetical protein